MILPSLDLIAGIVGFTLTVFIFSYLLGDNPLYRIATYIFVGASAGYIAAVAFWEVLMPRLIIPLSALDPNAGLTAIVPLILSVMILIKISPRMTKLASPAMAFLVGVGAAVAVGGAVTGTIIPQVLAAIDLFDMQAAAARNVSFIEAIFNGALILAGAATTLAYFHFGARTGRDGSLRRNALIEIVAFIGRIFIAVTLGVLFAGVYSAALAAFVERVHFLVSFIMSFLGSL
jgi:hypothetical protein